MIKPTRRGFIASLLGAPVSQAFRPLRLLGAPINDPAWKRFENPSLVRYDASCFTINGRDAFLFGAEFHYPRCPQELWRDRFLKLKRAGFNTVQTVVFWNYHERQKGHFDFSSLVDFLNLAKEMGFWVILRPGPFICAEWDEGGFPHWILAEQFPLRGTDPESLRTSKYWYDHVMPVIRPHQITHGGPIILMQIENEYDLPAIAKSEKRDYIRFLAKTVWQAGIDVPLFTNLTTLVRDPSDPVMARLMDTCDFYPRWKFMKGMPSELATLRSQQPSAPLAIAELQGGWFSKFGERLSVDHEGADAVQLNALTKTVLELGVTYLNYYMGFGGTNFDWAAKTLTTTYDYAAPIREPGGLWNKYYAARGIGEFLKTFGPLLARSQALTDACDSTSPEVSVTMRVNGSSGLLFVRADTTEPDAGHHFKLAFPDPASATRKKLQVPRVDELVIGPQEMKVLPVQVPIAGWHLRYSTAEYLAHGSSGDRTFLLVYDEPGRLAEIALAMNEEPSVKGDTEYANWDKDAQSLIIGLRFESTEKFILINDRLILAAVPRDVALRTWVAEVPVGTGPASQASTAAVPFITDTYLMAASGGGANHVWADLDFLPGPHSLTVLLPSLPSRVLADGKPLDFRYDAQFRQARMNVTTPSSPYKAVEPKNMQVSVERFEPASGSWISTPARPLEELGPVPYGYVKYRANISYNNEPRMFLAAFTDDFKRVFLDGKEVPEASNSTPFVEFSPAPYLKPGQNLVEISYEVFGSWNGSHTVGEIKGIKFLRLGTDAQTAAGVDSWQIQTFPATMRGREVDPEASFGGWKAATITDAGASTQAAPAFTWCRLEFNLPQARDGWTVPWKLAFDAACDALLYVNGKFVGRYSTEGPQMDFYLPDTYLAFGNRKNILTVLLPYRQDANCIRTLRVEPYHEFSVRRTRIALEW